MESSQPQVLRVEFGSHGTGPWKFIHHQKFMAEAEKIPDEINSIEAISCERLTICTEKQKESKILSPEQNVQAALDRKNWTVAARLIQQHQLELLYPPQDIVDKCLQNCQFKLAARFIVQVLIIFFVAFL